MDNPPIKIEKIMKDLAEKRPIFHSEADFQHALAWKIHEWHHEQYEIRLEYPIQVGEEKITVDIWMKAKQGEENVALELKYKKRKFKGDVSGEKYMFSSDGARDGGCYGFMEDTRRIECLVENKDIGYGAAIILSNEHLYWDKRKGKHTNFEEFSLYDGRKVDAEMEWQKGTGEGYVGKRRWSIDLKNQYDLTWNDYNIVQGQKFRWLMNEVQITT